MSNDIVNADLLFNELSKIITLPENVISLKLTLHPGRIPELELETYVEAPSLFSTLPSTEIKKFKIEPI